MLGPVYFRNVPDSFVPVSIDANPRSSRRSVVPIRTLDPSNVTYTSQTNHSSFPGEGVERNVSVRDL